MNPTAINLDYLPRLNDPLLVAGFEGWGNALDISRGMADYLVRKLDAEAFGRINPDLFYRFDENRPVVDIRNGILEEITPPGGSFYVARGEHVGRDIVVLKATEPRLHWFDFVDAMLNLCREVGGRNLISRGSLYDNVLHTDTVISAVASSRDLLSRLKEKHTGCPPAKRR